MLEFYQRVIQEDFELCTEAQKNLSRVAYVSGPLHPHHEEGILAFQRMVLEKIGKHLEDEKMVGREIWPAERQAKEMLRSQRLAKTCWGVTFIRS